MATHYNFLDGRQLSQLSPDKLQDESEKFTRWALKQQGIPNGKVQEFKGAFRIATAVAEGRSVCTADEEKTALALLEKGFHYSEAAAGHVQRNSHHGKSGKGRH